MLKACCECIAAANPREDHGAYGSASTRVNGSTQAQRAPMWPKPSLPNEIMFLLPKVMAAGDVVGVTGRMTSDPQTVAVSLISGGSSPDYQNIACQLEARFRDDKMTVKIVQDGKEEELNGDHQNNSITNWFQTGLDFKFEFHAENGYSITLYIDEVYVIDFELRHNINDIKFLTLHGDIEKVENLNFKFG